jgi:hypothetical protein
MVGAGCVVAMLMRSRLRRPGALDLALMALFWPLYGPLVFLAGAAPPPGRETSTLEAELLEALARVRGTPLAALLPGPEVGAALAERLRVATRRLEEIDALLARPDFDEAAATERVSHHEANGDARAAVIAANRVQSIRRLRALRDRFRRELSEVEELLAQLRIQAEVLHLAEDCDDGTRDLVAELLTRVEGLEELLETVSR